MAGREIQRWPLALGALLVAVPGERKDPRECPMVNLAIYARRGRVWFFLTGLKNSRGRPCINPLFDLLTVLLLQREGYMLPLD